MLYFVAWGGNVDITILVYTCWQNKQWWRGWPSALVWVVGLRLKWPEYENPQHCLKRLSGSMGQDQWPPERELTGEASLLWAGLEQQMLGMNISGILFPRRATISMNQMWRAKIFTSCVSGGSRLHSCNILVW